MSSYNLELRPNDLCDLVLGAARHTTFGAPVFNHGLHLLADRLVLRFYPQCNYPQREHAHTLPPNEQPDPISTDVTFLRLSLSPLSVLARCPRVLAPDVRGKSLGVSSLRCSDICIGTRLCSLHVFGLRNVCWQGRAWLFSSISSASLCRFHFGPHWLSGSPLLLQSSPTALQNP